MTAPRTTLRLTSECFSGRCRDLLNRCVAQPHYPAISSARKDRWMPASRSAPAARPAGGGGAASVRSGWQQPPLDLRLALAPAAVRPRRASARGRRSQDAGRRDRASHREQPVGLQSQAGSPPACRRPIRSTMIAHARWCASRPKLSTAIAVAWHGIAVFHSRSRARGAIPGTDAAVSVGDAECG
jgi:hypothetical protein